MQPKVDKPEKIEFIGGVTGTDLVEGMAVLSGIVVELDSYDERSGEAWDLLKQMSNELIKRSRLIDAK